MTAFTLTLVMLALEPAAPGEYEKFTWQFSTLTKCNEAKAGAQVASDRTGFYFCE